MAILISCIVKAFVIGNSDKYFQLITMIKEFLLLQKASTIQSQKFFIFNFPFISIFHVLNPLFQYFYQNIQTMKFHRVS